MVRGCSDKNARTRRGKKRSDPLFSLFGNESGRVGFTSVFLISRGRRLTTERRAIEATTIGSEPRRRPGNVARRKYLQTQPMLRIHNRDAALTMWEAAETEKAC